MRPLLATLTAFFLLTTPAAAAWTWPVSGEVITPYRNGTDPYASGQHRGIDIAAPDRRAGRRGRRRRGALRGNGRLERADREHPDRRRLRHLVPAPVIAGRARGRAGGRRRPDRRGRDDRNPLRHRAAPALRSPRRRNPPRLPRPAELPATAAGRPASTRPAARGHGTRTCAGTTSDGAGTRTRSRSSAAPRPAPGTGSAPRAAPGTGKPPRAAPVAEPRTALGTGRPPRAAPAAGTRTASNRKAAGRRRPDRTRGERRARGVCARSGREPRAAARRPAELARAGHSRAARTAPRSAPPGRRRPEPRLGARLRRPAARRRSARPHRRRPPLEPQRRGRLTATLRPLLGRR